MNIFEKGCYQEDLRWINGYIEKKQMNILVTGATGLIGSCIVDALIYANRYLGGKYTIYALGRDKRKLQQRFSYVNISDNIFFVVQDICLPIKKGIEIDYIIHTASNADPRNYAMNPVETILTNVIGTKNVLEYAKKNKSIQVLFTSTMEVYGNVESNEQIKEEHIGKIDFNDLRSGYPESKRVAELLCRSYYAEYQVSVKIARLGYIYGPTMTDTDNKVVAEFIRNILNNNDIVLRSKGEQRRSYCYVADAVSGLFSILFNGKENVAYNLSDKNSIVTIKELALIATMLSNGNIVYDTEMQVKNQGMKNAVLNTNALENLNWYARYDLKNGLKQTIKILSHF